MYITFAYSAHELPNGAFVINLYIIVVLTRTPPPPLNTVVMTGGFVDDPPLFDRFANFQIPDGLEIDLDDFIFNPDIDGILQIEPDVVPVPPPVPLPLIEVIDDTGAGRPVDVSNQASVNFADVVTRFGEPPSITNPSTGEINYLFQFGSDSESDATGSDPEITPEPGAPPVFTLPLNPPAPDPWLAIARALVDDIDSPSNTSGSDQGMH